MINNIILKFIGTGINNNYQAIVRIYDKYNNLLYNKKTYNGKLNLSLKKNTVYKLVATSCDDIIKTSFYVTKYNNDYIFIFNRSIFNNSNLRTITFLLRDANYDNLPIEKGEMFLWQK